MEPANPAVRVVIALVALALLRMHLWRAFAFLIPSSMRTEQESPPDTDPLPTALEKLHAQLKALGFSPLGTRLEHPVFGKRLLSFDYGSAELGVFASAYEGPGHRVKIYFLSPTQSGGFVLTANFRRPAQVVEGKYMSGYLDVDDVERLLKAHQRRLPELGGPRGTFDMDARVAAAKEWYLGYGKAEVRQQNAVGLLWTMGALGMVGAAILGRSI